MKKDDVLSMLLSQHDPVSSFREIRGGGSISLRVYNSTQPIPGFLPSTNEPLVLPPEQTTLPYTTPLLANSNNDTSLPGDSGHQKNDDLFSDEAPNPPPPCSQPQPTQSFHPRIHLSYVFDQVHKRIQRKYAVGKLRSLHSVTEELGLQLFAETRRRQSTTTTTTCPPPQYPNLHTEKILAAVAAAAAAAQNIHRHYGGEFPKEVLDRLTDAVMLQQRPVTKVVHVRVPVPVPVAVSAPTSLPLWSLDLEQSLPIDDESLV
jgi:hypothetical protein